MCSATTKPVPDVGPQVADKPDASSGDKALRAKRLDTTCPYIGRKVTWRTPTDVVLQGTVTGGTHRDMLYIALPDGREYYVPLHAVVWGWITVQ